MIGKRPVISMEWKDITNRPSLWVMYGMFNNIIGGLEYHIELNGLNYELIEEFKYIWGNHENSVLNYDDLEFEDSDELLNCIGFIVEELEDVDVKQLTTEEGVKKYLMYCITEKVCNHIDFDNLVYED